MTGHPFLAAVAAVGTLLVITVGMDAVQPGTTTNHVVHVLISQHQSTTSQEVSP